MNGDEKITLQEFQDFLKKVTDDDVKIVETLIQKWKARQGSR